MENFNILQTNSTPEVQFLKKSNQLTITGRSINLFSEKFWNHLKTELKNVLRNDAQLNILLNFEYINTRNVINLHDLLREIGNDKISQDKLNVKWEYAADDFNSRDLGAMLQKSSGIHFDLVSVN